MLRLGPLLLLLTFLVPPAFASDGVVEINQAKALAGGVTASDAPGFPVTIDAGGSYKLTGSLTNLNADVNTIELKASLTTLDLNGFTVSGPTTCSMTASGVMCSGSGPGNAIEGFTGCPFGNVVKNGTIYGAPDTGVRLCVTSRVEDVQVIGANGFGISVNNGSFVQGCAVVLAGTTGYYAPFSSVFDSSVRDSGRLGDSFGSGITGGAARNMNLFGLYQNQYFDGTRILGPNMCDGNAC